MDLDTLMTLRSVQYVPLKEKMLPRFDTQSVGNWLSDLSVRSTLFTPVSITINDPDKEDNRMEIASFFDSPYFSEYTSYIADTVLPQYLAYLRVTKPPVNDTISLILGYLISASKGNITIPTTSMGFIITDLFPHLKMIKQPDEGNCYFCSTGYNLKLSSQEVRNVLADAISKDTDMNSLVSRYIDGCATGSLYYQYDQNPIEFTRRFPQLLRQNCNTGDRDCNECVWGGNEYDSYLASEFQVPVISIGIERQGKELEIDLDSYGENANVLKHYLKSKIYRMRIDQDYTINITYTFPPDVYITYDDIYDAFFEEYNTFITYIFNRSHINAASII